MSRANHSADITTLMTQSGTHGYRYDGISYSCSPGKTVFTAIIKMSLFTQASGSALISLSSIRTTVHAAAQSPCVILPAKRDSFSEFLFFCSPFYQESMSKSLFFCRFRHRFLGCILKTCVEMYIINTDFDAGSSSEGALPSYEAKYCRS